MVSQLISTATGPGATTLFGLPADTDVRWRLAHGDWKGAWQTTRTGPLPEGIPRSSSTTSRRRIATA